MSNLTKAQQERVARALVREYRYLGVVLQAAREEVALGKWDDHPAATRGEPKWSVADDKGGATGCNVRVVQES